MKTFSLKKGATYIHEVELVYDDGTPMPLPGGTGSASLVEQPGGPEVEAFDVDVSNIASGFVRLELQQDQTDGLGAGAYFYDLKLTDTDGTVAFTETFQVQVGESCTI